MATVKNEEDNIIVYGTDLNDNLFNENVNVKIFGYEGNDTIENRGYEVIIEGGAGNDYIYSDVYSRYGSENYRRATIYGGTGNDTIRVNDNETSLNAGAGNDYISVFSGSWENNTLQGGQGNDTIYGGKSNVIIYEEGDGNDTIFCGYSTDTIQIASNRGYTSVRSGNDVIITVGNGSLLLKNPAGIKINTAPQNMNGTTNNDEIFNTSSYKTILADAGADILYNIGGRGSKLDGGTGNDFIYNGTSVENLYNASKKTLDKVEEITNNSGDTRNQLIDEAKNEYLSYRNNLPADIIKKMDDIFSALEGTKTGLSVTSNILEKINDAVNLINEIDELSRITWTFDNVAYSQDLEKYRRHIEYIHTSSNLTETQRQHFRNVIERYNPNNSSNYNRYFQGDSLKIQIDAVRTGNKSLFNKVKDVGNILEEAKNNVNLAVPMALKRTNALSIAGWALNLVDLEGNLISSYDARKEAWSESEGANILEKIHDFGNKFKEKDNGKYYDKLNLSIIDIGSNILEGIAIGVGTSAAVLAGLTAGPILGIAGGIGVLFYGATALVKTGYSCSQHSDVDFWETLKKNLNPFDLDDSTYVSKRLMESYSLNVASIDISIEIITIIGGKGNDTLLNDRYDNVVIDAGDADDMIINQESENVSINAGNGNDSITNINSSNVTIFGNAGNDLINNNSNSVTINAGDGNNSIVNYMGASISIGAGAGDDYIDNIGNYVTVDAGNGKNIVSNIGAHASLKTGKDDDEISLIGAAGIINAGAGSDYVYSHGDKNTIDTGDGNDSVENFEGSELVISTDNGKDYIESFGDSNTINAGQDDDVVNHFGNSSSIDGDSGDDYIEIFGDSNTAIGGNGSDYILVVGNKNSVYTGADSDILEIFGDRNTINSGKGNDYVAIDGSKNIIEYVDGDGKDVIEGFDSQSTLKILGNGYSTIKSSNDVIVKVGNGSISLIGAASLPVNIVGTLLGGNTEKIGKNIENRTSNTLVSGTSGDDSIYNNGWYVTINSGNGSDTIHSEVGSESVSIYAGDGDDYISSYNNNYPYIASSSVTLNAGNGDDTIIASYVRSKVTSGTGNDSIYGGNDNDKLQGDAGNDTLNGGTGNDTLTGGAGNDVFVYEGGKDIITDYAAGQDTIKVSGTISKVSYSGKNVIFTIGSGSLTVNNAKGKEISVINSSNKTQTYSRTLEILYDNNFMTDEIGIDEISEVTETNYSVGQIESMESNEKLKISDSIVSASTFAEK